MTWVLKKLFLNRGKIESVCDPVCNRVCERVGVQNVVNLLFVIFVFSNKARTCRERGGIAQLFWFGCQPVATTSILSAYMNRQRENSNLMCYNRVSCLRLYVGKLKSKNILNLDTGSKNPNHSTQNRCLNVIATKLRSWMKLFIFFPKAFQQTNTKLFTRKKRI